MKLALRRLAAPAAIAALCLSMSFAAQPEELDATYSIRLLGLPIGIGSVTAKFTGANYSIEANGKLTGLANLVSSARGAVSGSGEIVEGRIAPGGYATTAVNSSFTRTIRMALAGNAVANVEIEPPFEERPDRIPVSDSDRRNILDPVGAFVVPSSSAQANPSVCDRTLHIFDGWTRFDLALTFVELKDVSAKGFNGKAAVCAVRYTPISGHRRDRPATKFMAENKDLEVWLAPIGSSKIFMPIRISARTMVGTVVVDATQFEVR